MWFTESKVKSIPPSVMKKQQDNFTPFAKALGKYIQSLGGTALVVGGVKIGQELGARKYNYFIQVSITGKLPPKPKQ